MGKRAAATVTGFVLDPEKVQASDDGMTIPPLPGLWTNTTPILPDALGISLDEMRTMVAELDLPLIEVDGDPSEALAAFPKPSYLIASESGAAAIANAHGEEPPAEEPSGDGETTDPATVDVTQAEAAADAQAQSEETS